MTELKDKNILSAMHIDEALNNDIRDTIHLIPRTSQTNFDRSNDPLPYYRLSSIVSCLNEIFITRLIDAYHISCYSAGLYTRVRATSLRFLMD